MSSFDEDNALISLVKEYQSKKMIVTQVFEEVESLMPLTHILYSRSEEALGTHYRKLVNDQECPTLRGSIARKGGGQADKKSAAARSRHCFASLARSSLSSISLLDLSSFGSSI
jgi:hypothetical protein